ncbi:MAG TPA: hypothetical protein VF919_06385 [Gemmatimonadales bacterium]
MRYRTFHERLKNAVLTTPGATPESLRRSVLERAQQSRPSQGDVPPALTRYVDTVALHAYKVTDAGVAELQRSGNSDDTLFEITVAAAVGAALHRLDRGMAALRGEEPD